MPAKKTKKSAARPKPSAPRAVIHRLELTPESKRRNEAVADHFGMTQIAALSRLVEWYAGQSPEVQNLVNAGGNAARPVLAQIADRR